MNWKQSYQRLRTDLQRLPVAAQRLELLGALQGWLKNNLATFGELAERYGLAKYASIDLSQFPLESSSLNVAEELKQEMALAPSSIEVLAQRLRDLFWEGTTIDTGMECPACNSAPLRVLQSAESDAQPILACDMCSRAQTVDGKRWQGDSTLIPPTRSLMERWRAAGLLSQDITRRQ